MKGVLSGAAKTVGSGTGTVLLEGRLTSEKCRPVSFETKYRRWKCQ